MGVIPPLLGNSRNVDLQDSDYAASEYVVVNNDIPLDKQVLRGSVVYVVKESFDLGCLHKTVKCNKPLANKDFSLFYDEKRIHLKKDETVALPKNALVLDSNFSLLAKGYFKARQAITIYLASTKEEEYDYWIGEELTMPERSVLKFEGGALINGIIDLSGSLVDAYPQVVFQNTVVRNQANNKVQARWFFQDGDIINSTVIDNLGIKEIDFSGLSLTSDIGVSFANANWKNLTIKCPHITIGEDTPIKVISSISRPLGKDEYTDSHIISITGDMSSYKGDIVLISTGMPVDYDCREVNGLPTLYKGVTSIIEKGYDGSIVVEDYIENFEKENHYTSESSIVYTIESRGYVFDPCHVRLENCTFISSQRTNPGFMYVYACKGLYINNCVWDGGEDGTPSLLGINNCVNGIIQNSIFSGAFYEGTKTSYGLQLFNSTRINTYNCTFSHNRRGYDVSGNLCQTRYCVVENCMAVGPPLLEEGSGLGGHSTSYGNTFRNNIIEGASAITGIQTRGDKEIIEGNIFYGKYKAAAITCVKNTVIRNNVCIETPTPTFVWIESCTDKNNEIVVEGNKFSGETFVRGQKVLTCNVIIRDNSFYFTSDGSSLAPFGDNVTVNCYNNRFVKASDKAVLYYKLNTTVSDILPQSIGVGDKVDFHTNRTRSIVQ